MTSKDKVGILNEQGLLSNTDGNGSLLEVHVQTRLNVTTLSHLDNDEICVVIGSTGDILVANIAGPIRPEIVLSVLHQEHNLSGVLVEGNSSADVTVGVRVGSHILRWVSASSDGGTPLLHVDQVTRLGVHLEDRGVLLVVVLKFGILPLETASI